MSHPPKTSLSSRELAERVMHCGTLELQPDEIEIDRAAALIETHVSEAVLKEAEWWAENIERWFGGHSEVTRERLAMIHRKLVELK